MSRNYSAARKKFCKHREAPDALDVRGDDSGMQLRALSCPQRGAQSYKTGGRRTPLRERYIYFIARVNLRRSAATLAGLLGGAPAPLISTALVHWAGGASWPVATYLAASAFITIVAAYFVFKRHSVTIIA